MTDDNGFDIIAMCIVGVPLAGAIAAAILFGLGVWRL